MREVRDQPGNHIREGRRHLGSHTREVRRQLDSHMREVRHHPGSHIREGRCHLASHMAVDRRHPDSIRRETPGQFRYRMHIPGGLQQDISRSARAVMTGGRRTGKSSLRLSPRLPCFSVYPVRSCCCFRAGKRIRKKNRRKRSKKSRRKCKKNRGKRADMEILPATCLE